MVKNSDEMIRFILTEESRKKNIDPLFEEGWPEDLKPVKTENGEKQYETSDEAWIKKAEKAGIIKRLAEVFDIGIQKITIMNYPLKSEPLEYHLEVVADNGVKGTIILPKNQILSPQKFELEYISVFGRIPPSIKPKIWRSTIRPFIENAEKIVDTVNSDPVLGEIINKIENSTVVKTKEEYFASLGQSVIWFDLNSGTLRVGAKDIEAIADKYQIDQKTMRDLLRPYLKGNSIPIRHGKGCRVRVWQFDPKIIEGVEETV